MTIKAFRVTRQDSPDNVVLQTAIRDFSTQLSQNPLLDQTRIEQLKVSTTVVDIPHSLGRRWVGWVVTRSNSPVTVYEAAKQADPNKYISLVATGSGVIDLYLF